MFSEKESYPLEKLPDENENSSITKICSEKCDKNISTNERSNQNVSFTKLKTFLGLFYLFFQSIFVQSISVIVKKVSYISTSQLALIRYAGMFAVILPLAIFRNKQTLGEKRHRFLLVVRGLLAANGLFFQIVAYRYLQLIEASIVMATFPFVTAITARILLKEHLGRVQTVTLITTICGVLLSLRLPVMLSDKIYTDLDIPFIIGLVAAIASVLCLALSTVAIRKLKEVHFSIILLYMSFTGVIENSVLNGTVFPLVVIKCGWDQVLCMLVGMFGAAANGFLILATQVEPVGLVAVQKSSYEILVSAVFQILFFSVYPDVYSISGAVLVLISLIVIGFKNWILTLPETSNKRQKLKWILS